MTKSIAAAGLAILAAALFAAGAAAAAEIKATPQTYWSAIQAAKGGDTVILTAGAGAVYPELGFRNLPHDGVVVVKAEPGVTVAAIYLDAVSNMTFQGLEIVGAHNGIGVTSAGSSNLRFEGLHIHGQGDAALIRNSKTVTLTGSELDHIGNGVSCLDSTDVTVANNHIHDGGADGIHGACSSWSITGNRIHDFTPPPGAHPDGIQLWATALTPMPTGITITGNDIERGAAGVQQCIFGGPAAKLTIAHNSCLGTLYNGIAIGAGSSDVTIDANLVLPFADQASWIMVRHVANAHVTNNVATDIRSVEDQGPNPGYVASGNTIVQPAAVGDRSALVAWLAARDGVKPAPAPTPAPPPVAPPAPDPRDARIAALSAQLQAATAQAADLATQLQAAVSHAADLAGKAQADAAAAADQAAQLAAAQQAVAADDAAKAALQAALDATTARLVRLRAALAEVIAAGQPTP